MPKVKAWGFPEEVTLAAVRAYERGLGSQAGRLPSLRVQPCFPRQVVPRLLRWQVAGTEQRSRQAHPEAGPGGARAPARARGRER